MNELHLTKADFRVDWFSGTGAGGQYRNKHQNCCRITHKETGLMATGQSNRDRPANQKEAFNKLAKRLIAHYFASDEVRREHNNVVRTYHFERGEAVDGAIRKPVSRVMDGDLDEFIHNSLTHGRPERSTGRM